MFYFYRLFWEIKKCSSTLYDTLCTDRILFSLFFASSTPLYEAFLYQLIASSLFLLIPIP
ncbi:hypothetical protein GLOIN_2v1588552 [Rhizophagus irregularis DAOM 181602=DAOM 197198]|uniref:Uncharacterized protein n=1 Tax=Rhizophagus irregularis (strain DAOM 181602 / DAOM 197198 / MUCL 43194) TaxID=747089 RepID=A0A2P4Q6M6_RHIID|nr:hypothetical protein GLOIN_2v1588552 [Rhizophagus irregularis DAOM 181602=DAOM 197198]POG73301.1 hypothetical protein GLOIN_2v1588552 [Rhizophagus irregularis DAOM 181602=DAOM 197198]|eukprot:XP_025180167.1 hypothetical protein GLOIN_2v1588552 [Rhizophagus irregularis DAOM 181602=DAOM 197198]